MSRRMLRSPALHFLVGGGLLFALHARWQPAAERERPHIVLTPVDVERLRADWAAEHGAPPGADAERALIDDAVDEEILYREAVSAGLDRQDRFVRTRLAQLASFLGEASEGGSEATLREARRLDLTAHDVVIRRHLIQVMRLALSHVGRDRMPPESGLQAYLDAHADRFRQEPLVRMTHVFLARDRHGTALASDARRLLDELRRDDATPETAPPLGDPFLRGAHPAAATAAGLDQLFGPGFAAAIRDAPAGRWIGPVAGAYGMHLVWIHERTPGGMPPLDVVRAQVAHGLIDATADERLRSALARLRAQYEISVAQ
jgi:PPIC-type PPIASE domain